MKVRIMCGGLSNRIFAVKRYTTRPDGLIVAAVNGKDDVTEEAIYAVAEHRLACKDDTCRCGWLSKDWQRALQHENEVSV